MSKQIIPPSWFDLKEICAKEALYDIRRLTHYYKDVNNQLFENNLENDLITMWEKNRKIMFGYIPALPEIYPDRDTIMKKVMGENGYWLKKTNEKSDVYFIWYDKSSNNFMFWAPCYYKLSRAMHAIRWRIIKYSKL